MKEIVNQSDIDNLELGDEVGFCINDQDSMPQRGIFRGRIEGDYVFEGENRNTGNEFYFGVQRHELSPVGGRIRIQDRVTIRHYNEEEVMDNL